MNLSSPHCLCGIFLVTVTREVTKMLFWFPLASSVELTGLVASFLHLGLLTPSLFPLGVSGLKFLESSTVLMQHRSKWQLGIPIPCGSASGPVTPNPHIPASLSTLSTLVSRVWDSMQVGQPYGEESIHKQQDTEVPPL